MEEALKENEAIAAGDDGDLASDDGASSEKTNKKTKKEKKKVYFSFSDFAHSLYFQTLITEKERSEQ